MAREQRSKTRCHRCSDDDDDAVLLLLLLLLGPVGGGCMRRRLEPPPPPGDVVCCRCCAWSSSSCRRAPQACSFPSSRSAPGSSASNSSPLLEDIVWKANEGRWKCCAPDGQAGPLLPRSAAGVASTAAHWERGGRRRRERPAAKCQPASSSCWQQAGPGRGGRRQQPAVTAGSALDRFQRGPPAGPRRFQEEIWSFTAPVANRLCAGYRRGDGRRFQGPQP
jgi:hypothetical protein